jgi:hypothetical protein
MKYGNLASFAVVIDEEGNLHTETCQLPLEEVDKVFPEPEDRSLVHKAIKETLRTFEGLHDRLERELKAFNSYKP